MSKSLRELLPGIAKQMSKLYRFAPPAKPDFEEMEDPFLDDAEPLGKNGTEALGYYAYGGTKIETRQIEAKESTVLDEYEISSKGKIVIHSKRCAKLARHLGCNAADVKLIVLIHEVSHLVQHKGSCDGHIWEDFAGATKDDKERFAQESTYLYIRKHYPKRPRLLEVFRRMSDISPKEYRNWTNLANSCGKKTFDVEATIGRHRAEVRRKREDPLDESDSIDIVE